MTLRCLLTVTANKDNHGAGTAPLVHHPPGLSMLHVLGEARACVRVCVWCVCVTSTFQRSCPYPRSHGWQNLEPNQLGTEGSALVPGPSLSHRKGQRPLETKCYPDRGKGRRPLSLRSYIALPPCPPGAEPVLPQGIPHPARFAHTRWCELHLLQVSAPSVLKTSFDEVSLTFLPTSGFL